MLELNIELNLGMHFHLDIFVWVGVWRERESARCGRTDGNGCQIDTLDLFLCWKDGWFGSVEDI